MSLAALVIIDPNGDRPKCPSAGDQISKLVHLYDGLFLSKRKKSAFHAYNMDESERHSQETTFKGCDDLLECVLLVRSIIPSLYRSFVHGCFCAMLPVLVHPPALLFSVSPLERTLGFLYYHSGFLEFRW